MGEFLKVLSVELREKPWKSRQNSEPRYVFNEIWEADLW